MNVIAADIVGDLIIFVAIEMFVSDIDEEWNLSKVRRRQARTEEVNL